MAIERRLTEIVGPVGGKLHTARSRNDQVATDMAMFTRAHALADASSGCSACQSVLVQLAERHLDWAMPGYTHLQRAQPVYLAHHLLAYFWMFRRDARRFEFVLGGTDPAAARRGRARRRELRDRPRACSPPSSGFTGGQPRTRSTPSPTATSCWTSCPRRRPARRTSQPAGRGDRAVVQSEEFGFCRGVGRVGVGLLDHAAEEEPRRGRAAARQGAARRRRSWSALHGVMHGLPLTYNKDMQEDKEHLFDAVDTLDLCLAGGGAGCSRASRSTASGWPARRPTS